MNPESRDEHFEIPGSRYRAPRNDDHCPLSVSTFSQPLLSLGRFCLRQASTAWSPSFMTARQCRDTSRVQAELVRSPCADAAEATSTSGMMKRILDIMACLPALQ